jgi:hypothetical protein
MSLSFRTTRLLFLSVTIATLAGCAIHYHYQAKIIEIRLRKSEDLANVWSRITAVVEAQGYRSDSSLLESSMMSRRFSRPLRFFSPPSTIHVDLYEKSNVLYLKKIRVGQIKSGSSWDLDSGVNALRDKISCSSSWNNGNDRYYTG